MSTSIGRKAERILKKRGPNQIITEHMIIYCEYELPRFVYDGWSRYITVSVYIPEPTRCYRCQQFGHKAQTCRSKKRHICSGTHDSKGMATFIKEGIAYSRCADVIKKRLEAVVIEVHTDQGDLMHIANVYIPPTVNIIKEDLRDIFQLNKVLICGEFNAKSKLWGSPINDPRGNIILKMLEDPNLTILNTGEGTRLGHDGTYSHLDISITSSTLAINSNWAIIDDDEWGSDHLPTMITINETPPRRRRPGTTLQPEKGRLGKISFLENPTF